MVPETEKISSLVRQSLIALGEDPQREGLLKTPTRVVAALEYLTSGTRTDPKRIINDAIFTQEPNSARQKKKSGLKKNGHPKMPVYP